MSSAGSRFAECLAAKDVDGLRAVLAPDVDFRGLTPGRPWEAAGVPGVVEVIFGAWFEPSDEILATVEVQDGDDVADTHAVSYRLRVRNDAGTHLVEQQAYYRCDGEGRIAHLRVLCSGFRPVE
jgi:ketosteroid isomerase-like protein